MSSCSKTTSKCEPCHSLDKSSLLDGEALKEQLSQLPLWSLVPLDASSEGAINTFSRTFTCKNFQAALDAVNAMGAICESLQHHADFHLTSYRNVTVQVYTHKVGGLTLNDLELCKELDSVKVSYSPKWLKSNPAAEASALSPAS